MISDRNHVLYAGIHGDSLASNVSLYAVAVLTLSVCVLLMSLRRVQLRQRDEHDPNKVSRQLFEHKQAGGGETGSKSIAGAARHAQKLYLHGIPDAHRNGPALERGISGVSGFERRGAYEENRPVSSLK